MAVGRAYKIGVFDTSTWLAAGAAVAGVTTPVPILYGTTGANSDCNISCIRPAVMGAAAFPAGASVAFSLNLVSGTVAGGNAALAKQLSGVVFAARTTFLTAGGTSAAAITGLTAGVSLWSHVLPFTGGADWESWVTPGFEINIPVSTPFALFATCSSAGTATACTGELELTE